MQGKVLRGPTNRTVALSLIVMTRPNRMMTSLFLLLCCLPLLLAAQDDVQTEVRTPWEYERYWQEYQNLDGRFQLLSPAAFKQRSDTLETNLGQQVQHTFHFETPDPATAENVIYALSYVDYPAGSLHHDSTDLVTEFFAGTQEAATEALRGTLIYGSDKEVSGYPARQWRIDYKEGDATARTLVAVVGNRYYEVKIFSLKAAGPNRSANRFFESVRFFAPPAAEAP